MKVLLMTSQIKYFSVRQSSMFLSLSLGLLWSWMLLCTKIDRDHDRGLLTLVGVAILMSIVLSVFFSTNIFRSFVSILFRLVLSVLIIFVLSLSLEPYVRSITNLGWTGFIVPFVSLSVLSYFNLRLLFAFPNNLKAFVIMLLLPLLTAIILYLLPFYDDYTAYEYGIGFPLAVYLSLLCISISILCHQK